VITIKSVSKQRKYRLLLAQSFLFSGIDVDTVGAAYDSEDCTCEEFEPDEPIYTRTHFQKSMGLVLTGELKACKIGVDGQSLILNRFSAGGIFGIAGLFNNSAQYVSDVIAVKRSRVLFLPQTLLHTLFQQDCRIAENYIGYLSNRICFLNGRIDNYTGGSAQCRLATYLLSISSKSADPLSFELPCAYTRLSNTLDIGRASLYRALDELCSSGVISRSGKTITILDLERLKSGGFT
jgi:CRP-like cAMP-binding protein